MKDKFEILKNLENKCANIEDKLLTNVISGIAKKIDTVESKINPENYKSEKMPIVIKQNKLSELENIIKTIESELNVIEIKEKEKNLTVTTKISNKIEENYKILKQIDDMEKPYLKYNNIKKTEPINGKIEEKISEMNEKLQHLFLNNNKTTPNNNYKISPDTNTQKINNNSANGHINDAVNRNGKTVNTFLETVNVSENNYDELINTIRNKFSIKKSISKNQDIDLKNKKKQDLINKLNETDTKIKALAGNILRNL